MLGVKLAGKKTYSQPDPWGFGLAARPKLLPRGGAQCSPGHLLKSGGEHLWARHLDSSQAITEATGTLWHLILL